MAELPLISREGTAICLTDGNDPLLTLLGRYEQEIAAFDDPADLSDHTDEVWDQIAHSTWVKTRDEIISSEPAATSLAGALRALDHVLQSEHGFPEREFSPDQQMLWLLIKSVRDYMANQANGSTPPNI